MSVIPTAGARKPSTRHLAWAWLTLAGALALHVADEALTGFLTVWNPTVEGIHARWPWAPLPTFRFDVWLAGLIALGIVLFLLSPMFFRGGGFMRVPAYAFAVLMIGNGIGHIIGTILGHTVAEVTFARPAPGFYSSPLLIAAAAWVIYELRRSGRNLRIAQFTN